MKGYLTGNGYLLIRREKNILCYYIINLGSGHRDSFQLLASAAINWCLRSEASFIEPIWCRVFDVAFVVVGISSIALIIKAIFCYCEYCCY